MSSCSSLLRKYETRENRGLSIMTQNHLLDRGCEKGITKEGLPVHFFMWLFLFPCDPNLHPKFSSQNSANHTFLRLLARVRLLKYRSNPILEEKYMISVFIQNQNKIQPELWRNVSLTIFIIYYTCIYNKYSICE